MWTARSRPQGPSGSAVEAGGRAHEHQRLPSGRRHERAV